MEEEDKEEDKDNQQGGLAHRDVLSFMDGKMKKRKRDKIWVSVMPF